MLAWKKHNGQYGLVKTEAEVPEIKADEVLVKVLATGICGTDFGIYKGYREVPEGLIPGHEFIGEIIAKGDEVVSVGLKSPFWGCGHNPGPILTGGVRCIPMSNGSQQLNC